MASDPFKSPKLLIRRGNQLIDEFEAGVQSYVEGGPAELFAQIQHATGERILYLRIKEDPPEILDTVFADAVNNFRHSLDQATNSAAVSLRGGERDCSFPIGDDLTSYLKWLDSNAHIKLPKELRPFIEAQRPHVGGDELLVALNRIANPNKHRALLEATASINATKLKGVYADNIITMGNGEWDATKKRRQFAHLRKDGEPKIGTFETLCLVNVGGAGPLAGKPANEVLRQFAHRCEEVVKGLEDETARIIATRA